MNYSYCTLFDSNYLDKGLVTIKSLREYTKSVFYVLCMDDRCYEVLTKLNITNVLPIRLADFEAGNLRLLEAKGNRSKGEYCWTCSASLILYVLKKYNEECCTYVDADMKFYKNPDALIDSMLEEKKSVLIVEHGFKKDFRYKFLINDSGRFCVEFNTFVNNEDGRKVLEKWVSDTLDNCSRDTKDGGFGDQKYLAKWPETYDCIKICDNKYAGVAPWNFNRFSIKEKNKIIFYHFHDLKYLERKLVNVGVCKRFWHTDMKLLHAVYTDYLINLEEEKQYIEKNFGFCPLIKAHPALAVEGITISDRIKALFSRGIYGFLVMLEDKFLNIMFGKNDIIKF